MSKCMAQVHRRQSAVRVELAYRRPPLRSDSDPCQEPQRLELASAIHKLSEWRHRKIQFVRDGLDGHEINPVFPCGGGNCRCFHVHDVSPPALRLYRFITRTTHRGTRYQNGVTVSGFELSTRTSINHFFNFYYVAHL